MSQVATYHIRLSTGSTPPIILHAQNACVEDSRFLAKPAYRLEYGGSPLYPLTSEDDDNIVSALKQSGRVSSIQLAVTLSLLEKISMIEEPFSNLENHVLLYEDYI